MFDQGLSFLHLFIESSFPVEDYFFSFVYLVTVRRLSLLALEGIRSFSEISFKVMSLLVCFVTIPLTYLTV